MIVWVAVLVTSTVTGWRTPPHVVVTRSYVRTEDTCQMIATAAVKRAGGVSWCEPTWRAS